MAIEMRGRGRMAIAAALLLALALLAAGCGGSAGPGVANVGNAGSGSKATSSEGAGGGGGEGPSTSSSGGGSAGGMVADGGNEKQMIEFAKCMRKNGEPDFPEPVEGRIEFHGGPSSGVNPGSAQFRKAQEACKELMPHATPSPEQTAKMQEQALKFSQCMRKHGLPNFPDPQFHEGGVSLAIRKGSGVDPNSPKFQEAQKACQSQLPGPKGQRFGGKQ